MGKNGVCVKKDSRRVYKSCNITFNFKRYGCLVKKNRLQYEFITSIPIPMVFHFLEELMKRIILSL